MRKMRLVGKEEAEGRGRKAGACVLPREEQKEAVCVPSPLFALILRPAMCL